VTVDVLYKGLTKESVEVTITPSTLQVDIPALDNDNEMVGKMRKVVHLSLWGEVDGEKSRWRVTKTKVEITLRKAVGGDWPKLGTEIEQNDEDQSNRPKNEDELMEEFMEQTNPYSSTRDWNTIDQNLKNQLENEKPEGEAALNQMFETLYAGADEETRRAMNKSYQTSGGTVLSTNWGEVKEKDYEGDDRQLVDGAEWRNYDGDVINKGTKL